MCVIVPHIINSSSKKTIMKLTTTSFQLVAAAALVLLIWPSLHIFLHSSSVEGFTVPVGPPASPLLLPRRRTTWMKKKKQKHRAAAGSRQMTQLQLQLPSRTSVIGRVEAGRPPPRGGTGGCDGSSIAADPSNDLRLLLRCHLRPSTFRPSSSELRAAAILLPMTAATPTTMVAAAVAASASVGRSLFNCFRTAIATSTGALQLLHTHPSYVMTALLWLSTFGIVLERETMLGKALSAPLSTMALALVAANVGLLPFTCSAYAFVNRYLVPLAVPLLLFDSDLRKVLGNTGTLLLAFGVGAVATVIGTIVAFPIVPMKSLGSGVGWKVACALAARHIGGAINFVAVAETLNIGGNAVAAASKCISTTKTT
jgi:Protein of unknown function (DUF819)